MKVGDSPAGFAKGVGKRGASGTMLEASSRPGCGNQSSWELCLLQRMAVAAKGLALSFGQFEGDFELFALASYHLDGALLPSQNQ